MYNLTDYETQYCQHHGRMMAVSACNNRLESGICICDMPRDTDKTNRKNAGAKKKYRVDIDMERLKVLADDPALNMKDISVIMGVNRWTIRERIHELRGGR